MTDEQLAELIGLSIDEELPESLRAAVEHAIADDPALARDAETLRSTVERLRGVGLDRPDGWFVERALQGLLREHDAERHDRLLKSA